jgi:zinc protease
MIALTSNTGVQSGLDALVTEMQRVARFGVTATELARAKQARLLSYERSVTESPDRESESRADEYTRNFLQNEALPTIWQELAFHRRFLPTITLEEINALGPQWFPEQNRLVIVSAPEAVGVTLPSETQLAATVKTATSRRVDPYVDVDTGQSLMDAAPKPGTIVKTTPRPGGVTEWVLSNGATVVLKPTTLKEDQILFRATAPGGTSVASDADFIAARSADDVIGVGGVGRFNDTTLDRMLSAKAVAVVPYFGEVTEGLTGGSTPQDIETMFQLLYLRFTCAAARIRRRLPRWSSSERVCSRIRWPVRTSCSARPCIPRSAAIIGGVSRRRRRPSISGTSRNRWRSIRRGSPTRATTRSSSSAASRWT